MELSKQLALNTWAVFSACEMQLVLATATAAAAAFVLWRRLRRPAACGFSRSAPVLCFGDSLTEGYFNVWAHPVHSPPGRQDPPMDTWPAGELDNLRFHPFSIHLGALLAKDAEQHLGGCAAALRFALCRAFSGWKATEMLAPLQRELAAGPWRAVVIQAGCNDIVQGATAAATLPFVLELHDACERAGVPVVVVPNTDADLTYHGMCADGPRQRAEIAKLAEMLAATKGRAVADARAAMPLSAELYDDCLHYSPAGSKRMAEVVHAALVANGL